MERLLDDAAAARAGRGTAADDLSGGIPAQARFGSVLVSRRYHVWPSREIRRNDAPVSEETMSRWVLIGNMEIEPLLLYA